MRSSDHVVTIGTDRHEVLQIRPGQEILQQIECRSVEPLQIVEEEQERMILPGEDPDKTPKDQLETPLRVLWRKLSDRWLFSDDEFQLGDYVDYELSIRAEGVDKSIAPSAQF